MLLGCIADDFTGASDLANVLARGGMHTIQFAGVPRRSKACEAAIVSLKSRSIPAAEAVSQSLAALDWLRAAGCRQILFKICSTFDSTPAGNIGPVAEALLDALGAPATIVCPAYPTLRRTIYRGHLFVGDRLLSESGLERHPLNPMTDPDLVRWLGRQAKGRVGLIAHDVVETGATAVKTAIGDHAGNGRRLIIADCLRDGDLLTLGRACADMVLITGGSGIALGLPANFRDQGLLAGGAAITPAPKGRAIALAGSCSPATRAQIAAHATSNPVLQLDARAVATGEATATTAWDWLAAQPADALPLVYSSAEPEAVAAAQAELGGARLSAAIEHLFAELAERAVDAGVSRLIVAGGETSSAIVTGLGIDAMEIGPEIDPGVPMLVADRPRPLALALKSGNFGAPDFFAKALATMERSA